VLGDGEIASPAAPADEQVASAAARVATAVTISRPGLTKKRGGPVASSATEAPAREGDKVFDNTKATYTSVRDALSNTASQWLP
jgi:hypothetical protein